MIKYPKIETIFKRDTNGTKKLIEGEYRDETIGFCAGLEWVWTEKIDGTNIGIHWDGHAVRYQGRTERANIPAHLLGALMDIFSTDAAEEMFEQLFGEQEVVLFGEGYGPKIQNGGNYRDEVGFILFDVFIVGKNIWLRRESVESIAQSFGIGVVPIVGTGSLQEAVNFIKTKPLSHASKVNQVMEGVVCRPSVELHDRVGERLIVKVKVNDFT